MNRFTSQLFAPFRALGLITGDVPFLLERRGTENFVTLACEKSFQVLNVSFTHTHTRTQFSLFFTHGSFWMMWHDGADRGSVRSCTCCL